MNKRLLKIAVFLLLGAIINIAVALWISSRWPPLWVGPDASKPGNGIPVWGVTWRTETEVESEWIRCHRGIDDVIQTRLVASEFGIRIESYSGRRSNRSSGSIENELRAECVFAGWPYLAMSGGRLEVLERNERRRREPISHVTPIHALLIPDAGWQRVLPILPLWPGFAINTILYATVLWLPLGAPFALRRWRRRRRIKRGLCPACAYPVGASDVCTECGKPLPKRAEMTS